MTKGLKKFLLENEDPEFPDNYKIKNEIKSPLNVLFYNLNYEFETDYPAKMNPDFARDMIKIYSNENDVVLDGMCGSGTVIFEASKLNRVGIGVDVNPKAIELCWHKHKKSKLGNMDFICDDIRTFKTREKINLICSSPPFGLNIIGDKNHYSDNPKDISNSKNYENFFIEMTNVIDNYFKILEPNGILILDSRDRTKDGVYYDLGVEFRNIAVDLGFKVLARYWYLMIPYRQMTYKNKQTKKIVPMVSCMDSYVFVKPANEKLI